MTVNVIFPLQCYDPVVVFVLSCLVGGGQSRALREPLGSGDSGAAHLAGSFGV